MDSPLPETNVDEQGYRFSSSAPSTPRDLDNLDENGKPKYEGDVLKPMPEPERKAYVTILIEIVPGFGYRPTKTNRFVFDTLKEAEEVAERFCTINKRSYGVYGGYTEKQFAEGQWTKDRSTPCTVFESKEVIKKKYYYKEGPNKGKLAKTDKEVTVFKQFFGEEQSSKSIIEDKTVAAITGSLLTSYLDTDGNIIGPNATINGDLSGQQQESEAEFLKGRQRTRFDAMIDFYFRKYLASIQDFQNEFPREEELAHLMWTYMNADKELLGLYSCEERRVSHLPKAFAMGLRDGYSRFYSDVAYIGLKGTTSVGGDFNFQYLPLNSDEDIPQKKVEFA